MAKNYCLIGVLMVLFIRDVESDLFYDIFTKADPCESFCDKTYPSSTLVNAELAACCSRGCRFFNLVHLVEEKDNDLNVTNDSCLASCREAYFYSKDKSACNAGCSRMAKQKKLQLELHISSIPWSMYFEDGNSVFMLQPVDFEPDDVLTDPGLRRQLEHNWGFDGDLSGDSEGRLPETHVRTLPMDNLVAGGENNPSIVSLHSRMGGDWLDCAARKIGLPRMVLAGIVLFAALMALWLCLAPDRRGNNPNIEYIQPLDVEETKELLDPPPKYSLHADCI